MSTEKQIAANRRNAQKSTGPTSVEGKSASSMNALKTGIHAKSCLIPGERARDLQQLIDEYYDAYRPTTPVARGLVDDLILSEWMLRRLATSEASLWNYQHDDSFRPVPDAHRQGKVVSQNMKTFGAIQRRLDSTRRARARAIEALCGLVRNPIPLAPPQPEAPPDPATPQPPTTSAPIGFVPPTPPVTPATPTMSDSPLQGRIKNCLTSS